MVGTSRQSPSRSTPNARSSSSVMPGIPSKRCGYGGIVMRMSSDAIASAAAASQRSCASMNRASSARSSALGSRTVHSDRRAGRCSCRVARARCSALFAAATVVSSRSAVSLAGQPSTSRQISAARCFGGSTCSAARNASSIVSRSTARACQVVRARRAAGPDRAPATPPRQSGSGVPAAAAGRGTRSSRCGTARRGRASHRRRCRANATHAGTSPGRHPRPRGTTRASGSSARAARADAARRRGRMTLRQSGCQSHAVQRRTPRELIGSATSTCSSLSALVHGRLRAPLPRSLHPASPRAGPRAPLATPPDAGSVTPAQPTVQVGADRSKSLRSPGPLAAASTSWRCISPS